MMMSSSSSSSSSSSAAVRVEKATSDLLIGPDWTINMDICDSINSNHWLAKDVVKAVKKRLLHKSSTVQHLTLTLLETMVKNCGDCVHFHIVDRNILQEMGKMVKKKADTKVRTKILVLLDSWQEAFSGPGGKYPQYFWTYEELRRSGVQFPKRSPDAVPIFTPPVAQLAAKSIQPSSGEPSNASKRLDEAMASKRLDEAMTSEMESLSLSGLDAMRRVVELLTDMLRALNLSDREAVKDEVIVDLVDQCLSNQKRLMQMLTSTGDEEILARGLELNDKLQNVLAKHDAIASGLPLPTNNQITNTSLQSSDSGSLSIDDPIKEPELAPNSNSIVPVGQADSSQADDVDDDDDEDDDFSHLARRHSKYQNSQTASTENLLSTTTSTSHEPPWVESAASPSNALVLADPQPQMKSTREQDMIDFLSLALTTTSVQSPDSPVHGTPVSPTTQVHSNGFQTYPEPMSYNNYVAPWAQPQPQPQPQQFHRQSSFQQENAMSLATQNQPSQPVQLQHLQNQPYVQIPPSQQAPLLHQPHAFYNSQNVASQARQQPQMSCSPSPPQYSPTYIPPPWAATPGYNSNQNPFSNNTPHNYSTSSYTSTQLNRPQQYNTQTNVQNDTRMGSNPLTCAPAAGQKPFIPSYRLFEDLDVFRQTNGRKDSSTNGSPSITGGPGQGMSN